MNLDVWLCIPFLSFIQTACTICTITCCYCCCSVFLPTRYVYLLNRWACTHTHTSNSWPNNMYLVHTISLYRPTRLNENTRRRHGKKKRKETHKRGMKCEQHRIERRAILESSSRTFRRFVFLRKCTFSLSAQPATYVAIWVQCVPITLPTLISEDRDMRTDMVNIDDAPKGLVIVAMKHFCSHARAPMHSTS